MIYFNKKKQNKANQKGMTLIEVLIASIILFVAIGTISGIHRILNHYQRLNTADYALISSQASFFDYLNYSLGVNELSGEFPVSHYSIKWQATLHKQAPNISGYNIDSGIESSYNSSGELALYNVVYSLEQYPEKRFEVTQLVVIKE